MDTQEMLEIASKAAGLDLARWDEDRGVMIYPFRSSLTNGHEWNPREDDGDALRLAAHLRIDLEFNESIKTVLACAPGMPGCAEEWQQENRSTAVRLAITRAAVEIGRSM